MAFTETRQIFELINQSQSILLVFKKDWDGDALASSLALGRALRQLDKRVALVCQDFTALANLAFLTTSEVQTKLSGLNKLVVSVDLARAGLSEFYHRRRDDQLEIFLTPENGQLTAENVTVKNAGYGYDLIFVVGSPDLESLGEVYDRHRDFFQATPKVNLDHSLHNERFGDINLVNLTQSSTAEIVFELLNAYRADLVKDNIATTLLAGIILATKNFKTGQVSPRTLSAASLLITRGAARELIVKNLYQSRFVSTLKLWGRILSRLNSDLDGRLVWSAIAQADFWETGAAPEEMSEVVEELVALLPKAEVIVLLSENPKADAIEAAIYSLKNLDALALAKRFNATGNPAIARFSLPQTTLAAAERLVLEELKDKLKTTP